MKTFTTLAMSCALAAAGCAGPTPYFESLGLGAPGGVVFDPAEAAPLLREGTGKITGSAQFREPSGAVVSCAGNPVVLVPFTKYSEARLRAKFGTVDPGGPYLQRRSFFFDEPSEFTAATKASKCDEQGNFIFDKVASGEFFAIVDLAWKAGNKTQKSSFMQRFTVHEGQTVSLWMSP